MLISKRNYQNPIENQLKSGLVEILYILKINMGISFGAVLTEKLDWQYKCTFMCFSQHV